jgi:hypothetical protein
LACAVTPETTVKFAVFDLPDLFLSVKVPQDYVVITRDTVKGQDALEDREIDIAAFQAGFTQAGIYFNAMPDDFRFEYVITSRKTGESAQIGDLSGYDNEALNGVITPENLAEQFRLGGISAAAGPVLRLNGKVYYTIDFQQMREDGNHIYSRQFFTITNGIALNIIYNKYGEPINADDTEQCGKFIEGIVFSRQEGENSA